MNEKTFCEYCQIDDYSKFADIEKLDSNAQKVLLLKESLKKLPSLKNCGLLRTRIYRKIRSIRMLDAKTKGIHTENEWNSIKERYQYKCAYCGMKESVGNWLTKDHLLPISSGGSDSIENIIPLCGKCNSKKGVKIGQN